ncbi:hypothetical protein AC579_7263 [Pseudocercospora musae]|uniref:Uncharacterized protein n=1 Tax=Pseudocercospora musae TaxID=113226 RepID=A0A139I381_9PEZI|nr:hypothetical protein AC579_7263 [Pseudocercospora musae]
MTSNGSRARLLSASIEHRAFSSEHRASSIEQRASSIQHPASSSVARSLGGSRERTSVAHPNHTPATEVACVAEKLLTPRIFHHAVTPTFADSALTCAFSFDTTKSLGPSKNCNLQSAILHEPPLCIIHPAGAPSKTSPDAENTGLNGVAPMSTTLTENRRPLVLHCCERHKSTFASAAAAAAAAGTNKELPRCVLIIGTCAKRHTFAFRSSDDGRVQEANSVSSKDEPVTP